MHSGMPAGSVGFSGCAALSVNIGALGRVAFRRCDIVVAKTDGMPSESRCRCRELSLAGAYWTRSRECDTRDWHPFAAKHRQSHKRGHPTQAPLGAPKTPRMSFIQCEICEKWHTSLVFARF